MFCSKCGNQLKDSDRFCAKCGAPVFKQSEPQEKPAAEPVYSQAPVAGRAETQPVYHQVAGSVQKKSKKGLIIGFSLGGVLIAVLAVVLIFALGKKGDVDSVGSVPLGSSVVYDDQYTYFLSVTETWEPCIKRVRNDLSGKPELLYESEEIKGNGWSQYTLGNIFLWNDKICFMEITKATEQGDREYEIHWLSKNGKENGTLVSYEQLNTYGDLLSQMEGAYFFNDYLIFGNRFSFYRLDLNTGELCKQEDFLDLEGPVCFAAYNDGYYYYFIPDIEKNLMGETLYRKSEKSEEEIVGKVPSQDDDDVEKYFSFIPKGDYLYYADLDNIYRLNIEDGSTETLASYERTYNRFTMCENGLYYFKDMTLRFLNTETMEETVFDEVERIPAFIYAGANDSCWMQGDATSHRYNCFLPDEQGGSYTYFGEESHATVESGQDASTEEQETVNTAELYASIVESALERYGSLSFGGSEYECYAKGVIKLDLKDFNQDGTDELVMLYTPEGEGVFPVIDVWTVQNGEAIQLFSGRSKNESQESEITFSLYENAGCFYIPVYDSLDHNPVYVHLYGFDENGNFGEVYQYENNAFYMNQLPDGKKFAGCNTFSFYFNAQFSGVDAYESQKRTMEESLQGDMKYMLNELGIAMPENSSGNTFSAYDYEGNWTWQQEDSDMTASLQLKATDESTLSGELSFYRFFSDQLTITMSGNTGTVTSEFGDFDGTARFEAGNLYLSFEDQVVYHDDTISEMFGTTEFCFTSVNPPA